MKLQQEKEAGINQFTAFGGDSVRVNGEAYQGSLLVTPDQVQAWRPAGFADLQAEDFAAVLTLRPEVVLLGTGPKLRFPHPALYGALSAARIGVEVMDSAALCRTFNILCAEGRRVVALVLLEA